MRRGEVYDARLDPTEGSEQAGTRPVVIVSRDAINAASPVVVAVPCTTYRVGRRVYPSQVLLHAPDGGFDVDSDTRCGPCALLDRLVRLGSIQGGESPVRLARYEC